jgi:UDP-N-acetylglucosamine/UDP-N-acetylgalactosamine 4-epimerase
MNTQNKRVLVTGGAGFIGSNIAETLLKQGVKHVRILDNLVTGKMENIQFLLDKYDNIEFMHGSIADLETCRKAVKDIDVITNQAALGSVPRSVADPLPSHIANVNGFLNILVAAKEEGIKRVVYASSSSVYGDNPILPKVEKNTGNVLSPYAATKAIDEIYAGVFSRCYGMECIGLRYFNIFGPRQDPNGAYAAVIPKFIDLMRSGKQPNINGDGTFSRDFTYVENAVQANILGLTTDNEKCFGEAMNIGAGGQFTLLELIAILNKELGTDIVPIFGPIRPGDIPHSNADISKAQNMLGYDPKISFEDGIHKLITSYNSPMSEYINIETTDLNKLLGRDIINLNNKNAYDFLYDKKILITGGCGSIGSEIVRQLLYLDIRKLVIIDNSECGMFDLNNEINKLFPNNLVKWYLRDVTDIERVKMIFEDERPNFVFHAAAYKHVPIMEDNPHEAITVNIIGTKIIADIALEYNVDKFLFVSTDKAVNPINIMGTSKRISELYVIELNKQQRTEFIITRFGNVLGSSGSVIPTFIKNINENRNLQITHKDIIRYFMSIQEASQLVIQSITIGNGGQILLFDMGEPVKIIDLARNLIEMFPHNNTSIEIVGLRPGEKLYEELLCKSEEILPTSTEKIMILKQTGYVEEFEKKYNYLIQNYVKMSIPKLKQTLKTIVYEYVYNDE